MSINITSEEHNLEYKERHMKMRNCNKTPRHHECSFENKFSKGEPYTMNFNMMGFNMNIGIKSSRDDSNKSQVEKSVDNEYDYSDCEPRHDLYEDRLITLCERMCDIVEQMAYMNHISNQQNIVREPIRVTIHCTDDYDDEYDKAVDRAWRNFYRSNGV